MEECNDFSEKIKNAFGNIMPYIASGQYINFFDLTDYNGNSEIDNINLISYIEIITFSLIAEYKQSKK